MNASRRRGVLLELASLIAELAVSRPLRIAVDGRTASGKTTLADELAQVLGETGREVIRSSIDGFHRPKVERYARGRHSPEGYYHDARDLPAVTSLLLAPLGPGGDLCYCTASFDLENDRPIEPEPRLASNSAILIVDGTFLQRAELRDSWDLVIVVETSEQISTQRGIDRDAARLGGVEAARQIYLTRYKPAFDIYQKTCSPAATADAIIDNDDFERPILKLRHDGRLTGQF